MFDRGRLVALGLAAILVTSAVGVVAAQSLEPKHAHDEHAAQIEDIAFDEEYNVVWSLDVEGGFIGYHVGEEAVVERRDFETGHAIADGDGVVYVADRNTLWAFDVENREWSTVTESLDSHAGAIAYDATRNLVWLAGGDGVYGYHADNGSLFASHSEHSDAVTDVDVHGEYVVSGSAWGVEAIVYSVPDDAVAYEPDLPDDVTQVSAVDVTASGRLIVGTDAEERSPVLAFDIEQREQLLEYRAHVFAVSDLAYDPAGNNVISFGSDNTIRIYSVEQETVVGSYQHDDTIYAGVLDRHNRLLWFGDGEDGPGSVIAIGEPESDGATATETATVTPTTTPPPAGDATPTPTDGSAETTHATTGAEDAGTPSPETGTAEDTQAPTNTGGQFVVGGVIALIAVSVLLVGLWYRKR